MAEEQNLSYPNDESDNGGDDDNGVGLSLDIGGDDDDNDNENGNTNANDEDIRNQAGLNSPKNNKEMKLQLDDDSEATANPTPATAMRYKYNVNSPKGDKNKLDWGNDKKQGGGGGGVESLVTQVARPDANATGLDGNDANKTSKDEDDTSKMIQESQQTGGFCACFSNLFSCCSKPTVDTNHNGNDETALTSISPSQNDKPDSELIDKEKNNKNSNTNNKPTNTTRENSESVSSTIYDGNLLPPLADDKKGKKCLVLDLDETLVHSSFKPIPKPDFIIPVEIDRVVHHVYVLKRPFVDLFLEVCAKHYEIVIFTASLSKYADPLLDKLDPNQYISHRLFRESCVIHGTAYVKDLRKLGRKLKNSIIVDNSPPSYLFQPDCAVPITSWFDDQSDTQLKDFIPVLETTLKDIPDVRRILDAHNKSFRWLCNQANKSLDNYGY